MWRWAFFCASELYDNLEPQFPFQQCTRGYSWKEKPKKALGMTVSLKSDIQIQTFHLFAVNSSTVSLNGRKAWYCMLSIVKAELFQFSASLLSKEKKAAAQVFTCCFHQQAQTRYFSPKRNSCNSQLYLSVPCFFFPLFPRLWISTRELWLFPAAAYRQSL
jgi:hypothetical protein